MNAVGDVLERKERPAFVRFDRQAQEDKAASLREGHYVAKDVDYAYITPPYSKDVMIFKVSNWFERLKHDAQNGRIPQEWVDHYHKQYESWKRGEEPALNGTPIKGWGMISPAQQDTLIRMSVLTVEDLAVMNDEGIKRIGMGAVGLKDKAAAWVSQNKDKGPLTQEIAALKARNRELESSVETLSKQVESLMTAVKIDRGETNYTPGISASDLIEPDFNALAAQYKAKFGKAPHPAINIDTLKARLQE
jgi:cell division protein FtsB